MMVDTTTPTGMEYVVTVARQDERRAVAAARGHALSLNIKKGDGSAGFNAAETLLAALGACILTNVNAIAAKMRLPLEDAEVRILAARRDEPPVLTHITYELILDSPAPAEKLEELYRLAVKWGTVMSTLTGGLTPVGSLTLRDSREEKDNE
jgi:uncharacterized OsmC-like protein